MALCKTENLARKWATEKNDLRHESHVELKQKLPLIARAQMTVLNDDRKALLFLQDKSLMKLRLKLEEVAYRGKQLSYVFHNSRAVTLIRCFSDTLRKGKKSLGKGLAAETDDNYLHLSERERATLRVQGSGFNSQTAAHCPYITGRYLSPFFPTTASTINANAQVGVRNSKSLILVDQSIARPSDEDTSSSHSSDKPVPGILQERIDLDRQLSEERNLLAKRGAYLRECRVAGDKQKAFAQKELATAMLLLATAEKERAFIADCRATASEEVKTVTPALKICCPNPELETLEVPAATHGHSPFTTWSQSLQLHLGIAPMLSPSLSACPVATLTPPQSPHEIKSNRHSATSFPTAEAMTTELGIHPVPEPQCCLEAVIDLNGDEQIPGVTGDSGAKVEMNTVPGVLENPIGPYIRPPMPLEDMLKCIRCLFGKDKSLKTGNRARAFLGVPWSEIVSYDPDVLLRRGVLGIKEGSTGMASRLRMMTIIESALSNQNNVTIPPEVWERPTHFCDNCQKRYPISVSSNHATLLFEESTQKAMDVSPHHNPSDGCKPRTQEANAITNPRGKRNKKKLRGLRPPTHLPI